MKLLVKIKNVLLDNTIIYSLWASIFKSTQTAEVRKVFPELRGLRVLDLGCGPASTTKEFIFCNYSGLDLNPKYIEYAKKLYPQFTFYVKDVEQLEVAGDGYDLVLLNSFLHHIDDEKIKRTLEKVHSLLKRKGSVIIAEPMKPDPKERVKTFLMEMDRGDYMRTYDQYLDFFKSGFVPVKENKYPLKIFGLIAGWNILVMRFEKKEG